MLHLANRFTPCSQLKRMEVPTVMGPLDNAVLEYFLRMETYPVVEKSFFKERCISVRHQETPVSVPQYCVHSAPINAF